MKAIAASAMLLFVVATPVRGAVFTVNPIEDALVSSANPDSNYGGGGGLSVAAVNLPRGEFESLLKFDLASAKTSFDTAFGVGGWVIDGITLRLTANAPNNAIFNGNGAGPGGSNVNFAGQFSILWMQNDSWQEGSGTPSAPGATGITSASLPSFFSGADQPLGTFSFGGETSGSAVWVLTLAAPFVADVAAGNLTSLLVQPADTGVSYVFNSRSVGSAANRPALSVSAVAVPEPGGAALFGSVLLLLAVQRRRASAG
jgi:hypothetical protein